MCFFSKKTKLRKQEKMKRKFKRLIFLLLAFTMVISSFGLSACDEQPQTPALKDTPIKEDTNGGPLYTIQQAYDFGYIRGDDLKNVAYYYNPSAYSKKNANFVPMNKTPRELTKEREREICEYYIQNVLNISQEDEWDGYARAIYMGCYGNCYVVKINSSNFVQGEIKEKIIGTEIFYDYYPNLIYVWRTNESARIESGVIYTLEYAYSKGMIDKAQLESIAYYHNVNNDANYSKPNYVPIPKNPEVLDEQTQNIIKRSYLDNALDKPEGDIERVTIFNYFGCYNGHYVIRIIDDYNIYEPLFNGNYQIDGVTFNNYTYYIGVWVCE